MNIDVVELASELIAMPSETPTSNRVISDFLRGVLEEGGFAVEEVTYIDPSDEEKVSLIAKRGAGAGGLGLFSHSDTVPGDRRLGAVHAGAGRWAAGGPRLGRHEGSSGGVDCGGLPLRRR